MSLKDDILNKIDDPKAFTNQVSKLVHLPTNLVKSLTEPLGLKDYMNLAKAVDEQDPESAKEILQSGYNRLDDIAQQLVDENSIAQAFKQGYTSKTVSKNTASAGNIKGNTSTEPKSTQGTQGTQSTQDTKQASKDTAQNMMKNVDKEISGSIKKLQNDPEFAKIIKFADIVAKNKK
tara:strand:- start:2056 stop:2586 length:531 start_codon:yes stop_codon:yes gene_type:complete